MWSFPKNAREDVRVELGEYNGVPTVNLRQWYRAEDGEWRPTKKGITLAVRHLPALAECISKAEAAAHHEGLIDQREDAA